MDHDSDVLPLYWDGDGCPMVDLNVQGAPCPFSVDTGCDFTVVSLRQVEAWGLTAQIVPLEEPRQGNVGFL